MKITVLEYFITLSESQSINEAAQKLYISQPSLTKALQLFEKEIGAQLFYRTKNGIELTDAGKIILPEAKQMVSYYHSWLNISKRVPLKSVEIYIQTSFANFLLPKVVFEFKKIHPELKIYCNDNSNPEQFISNDTEKPVLSMFVCADNRLMEKYTKLQGNSPLKLYKGEYCCLVSKKNPLASKETINPEDLKNQYLGLKSKSEALPGALKPVVNEIFDVVSPDNIIQMDSVGSIIKMARSQSDFYALAYYPILKRYDGISEGEMVYIPFESETTNGDFCLFYSKEACKKYPVLGELVIAIKESAENFLREVR